MEHWHRKLVLEVSCRRTLWLSVKLTEVVNYADFEGSLELC